MSVDLQFRQDLPEIQEFKRGSPEIQEFRRGSPEFKLRRVKVEPLQSSGEIDDGGGVIQADGHGGGDQEECRTPKSPRNLIPETIVCPPAPKKQRRVAAQSCKRKLNSEFEFVEVVGEDEIDSFFRRIHHDRNVEDSGGSNKRNRTVNCSLNLNPM